MFRFAASMRTLGQAVAMHTPLHFDTGLVHRLLADHRELNARFASLVSQFGADGQTIESAVRECAEKFIELRRNESIWLYPVIARAIDGDVGAQQQFSQLRLLMLSSARRTLRLFDDLATAIRIGGDANAAADRVAEALAEYWQRNQAQVYPLYQLLGTSRPLEPALRAG